MIDLVQELMDMLEGVQEEQEAHLYPVAMRYRKASHLCLSQVTCRSLSLYLYLHGF